MHTIASGAASRSATNMPSAREFSCVTVCIVAVTLGNNRVAWCLLRVQCEVEGGAAPHSAFGPGAPAVAFDDPPDAGQADSGTRKLGIRMKPLERLEQLAHI